jgi:hypothetical protein
MPERIRCQGQVHDRDSLSPRFYQCTRKPVVQREGKHYCKIHDPEYIAAKERKWKEALDTEWQASREKDRYNSAVKVAFRGVTMEQITSRLAEGKCPCCGEKKA